MLGGALAGNMNPVYFSPDPSTKVGREDIEMETQLKQLLAGWSYRNDFMASFSASFSSGFQIMKIIVDPEPMFFKQPVSFYKKGGNAYAHDELVYDYSVLMGEGVKTVLEVDGMGFLTARTGLSGKVTPCFSIMMNVIDLPGKEIEKIYYGAKVGPKETTQEFEELLKSGGAVIQQTMPTLMIAATAKVLAKIHGKPEPE